MLSDPQYKRYVDKRLAESARIESENCKLMDEKKQFVDALVEGISRAESWGCSDWVLEPMTAVLKAIGED